MGVTKGMVGSVIVVEHGHLGGIGGVARGAGGEDIVPLTQLEMGGGLAGIGGLQSDEVLREHVGDIRHIISQFSTDKFPVRTLEPHIAPAGLRVDIHIEVAHAEAVGLEVADKGVRTCELVGLEDGKVTVISLALRPKDELTSARIADDVGTLQLL